MAKAPPKEHYIREHMDAVDMKQAHLARETGLNRGYVSSIYKGDKTPSPDVFARIAKVLDVHPEALKYPPDSKEARGLTAWHHVDEAKKDAAIDMMQGLAKRGAA